MNRDELAAGNLRAMIRLGIGMWAEAKYEDSNEVVIQKSCDAMARIAYQLADALIKAGK